jgi:hypothetical protein
MRGGENACPMNGRRLPPPRHEGNILAMTPGRELAEAL